MRMQMVCNLESGQEGRERKNDFHLGRTAILLWRRGQSECLVVGGWWLHVVVIVVAEAAEEGAENASAAMLL